MASPRTFFPGVQTGENVLNGIGQRFDRLFDNATPWATVTSGSEPDDVEVEVRTNETGTPEDTVFLERGWLAGMGIRMAWPVENTGAVTVAVNGGSALDVVTPEGDAIAAAQFPAGLVIELVYYDGALVVVSAIPATATAAARYFYIFTASGTWTKPTGLNADTAWHLRLWGAGGGGDNVVSGGIGGGSGAACAPGIFRHADLPSSVVVTIGAGGLPGSLGGNGGNSTFGSLLTGYGGGGFEGTSAPSETSPGRLLSAGTTTLQGGTLGASAVNAWDGGTGSSGNGGNAFWGGGGGSYTGTPGSSVFGGDGGKENVAGQAPGGGGGSNTQGGRGECWIFN
jgi:hypothetical protein